MNQKVDLESGGENIYLEEKMIENYINNTIGIISIASIISIIFMLFN